MDSECVGVWIWNRGVRGEISSCACLRRFTKVVGVDLWQEVEDGEVPMDVEFQCVVDQE